MKWFRERWGHLKAYLNPPIHEEAFKRPALPFRLKKAQLGLITLSINLLSLSLPMFSLQVYDRILANQNVNTLYVLVAGVLVLLLLEALARFSRAYIVSWANAVVEHIISCNLIRLFLVVDLRDLEKHTIGENIQTLQAISKVKEFLSGQNVVTLIDLPFVLVYLGFIGYLSTYLILAPITLVSLFSIIAWRRGTFYKSLVKNKELEEKNRFDLILESLTGVHTIKSFGLENHFVRKYEKVMEMSAFAEYFLMKERSTNNNFVSFFSQLMTATVVTLGAYLVLTESLTLGALIACVLLSGRIMNPIQNAFAVRDNLEDFNQALEKLNDIFKTKAAQKFGEYKKIPNNGSLELKNVSLPFYGLISDEKINLKLNRGDVISLTSMDKRECTFFLKTLTGVYQPEEGEVLINGIPSSSFHSGDLSRVIAYLSMDGVIFNGTIKDNITSFGQIDTSTAREVARLLDVDKDISLLPLGYETIISGGAADPIPPGLKQRLAIVRALATKPRIIIFDNADRALDHVGYNSLFRLFGRLKQKATIIIVSNDQNYLDLAQKHYSLNDGCMVLAKSNQASDVEAA